MSRPKGSIIGAKPTWTTTATSGIWTLRQAEEMKADGKWPRGPVAPTSLAGTPGDGQVALTWTAPATTHGTITDYVVEYTPAAGSPTVVATGSTAASYTVTGLTNGTEYLFRVAAVNHTRGDYSSSVAVTPSAAPTDPDFASVSLLLHLDGSDGSTTFTDSSGTPKTVTSSGTAAISTTESKWGGASLGFGAGGYLSSSSNAAYQMGTGDFAVEMWVQFSAVNVQRNILDFRGSADGTPWVWAINSNGTLFTYFAVGSDVSSTATFSANQWYHIALSRSSGTVRQYIDGVLDGQVTMTGNLSGSTLWIAATAGGGGTWGGGYIDDLRITKGSDRGYTGATIPVPTAAFPDA